MACAAAQSRFQGTPAVAALTGRRCRGRIVAVRPAAYGSGMSALETLGYAHRMEQGGFTRAQAATLAQEQARLIDERLATRAGREALRIATTVDIEPLRLFGRADLREFERRLTIRLGGMLVVWVGVLLAAIRCLPAHP